MDNLTTDGVFSGAGLFVGIGLIVEIGWLEVWVLAGWLTLFGEVVFAGIVLEGIKFSFDWPQPDNNSKPIVKIPKLKAFLIFIRFVNNLKLRYGSISLNYYIIFYA
ncbi:MAG: hypothetical protein COU31_03410 [Candidatus Magasanikbacteria bacterium CG10_big_fil_rev_8_21_14_0_10_40_10]|uniref:Uncharacterized protein n=1 Tax=Candidatus Magasanikbacteria bacterium CG10_big_fil_rev_8_21_14_0_10_40_10 TaxID=1974648 RepID=A0A2M6W3L3_9BACT|nr:MAG: hypothetical protein COU31_03410 [Candidatus Magasanikbacteria bacterium CG10_big_fil_rev_8_21_14_0_10_40_10]